VTVNPERLALVFTLAVLIYLTRIGGLLLGARQAPPVFGRALHYVPIAAFAALIVPGLAVPGEMVPRLAAAVGAGAVALRVGKLWAALLVGMGLYWGLRAAGV
jgi:branched-subunit amino acid transport protein